VKYINILIPLLVVPAALALVEFEDIPGDNKNERLIVNEDCEIIVSKLDRNTNYQKIECMMLTKCFGEENPLECEKP